VGTYWGAGIADYRVTQTPTRLSVSQGNTGRRVVGALIAVVGGFTLAVATGLLEPDEPVSGFARVVAVLAAVGFVAIGVLMGKGAGTTVAVFDRSRDAVVVRSGPTDARPVTRGLAELVGPLVEKEDFSDGDVGHRLVLLFHSGERLPLGQDFVGGASAARAAEAIRAFLGPRRRD
jgi:hypothetical protein